MILVEQYDQYSLPMKLKSHINCDVFSLGVLITLYI
jgi:hypothetical protein